MNRDPNGNRTSTAERKRWQLADRAAALHAARKPLGPLADATGIAEATLRRWGRVARAFPKAARTHHRLSFSHYESVAARADREMLLDQAERGSWSVPRLRTEAVAERQPDGTPRFRRLGVETLDTAIDYCEQMLRLGGVGETVVSRAARLASVAERLASTESRRG